MVHAVATSGVTMSADFPELLRRFDSWMQARGWAATTRRKYRYELLCFVDWCALHSLELETISEDGVLMFLAALPARGSKRGDASRAVKAFYRWAAGRLRIDNPSSDVVIPRSKAAPAPVLGCVDERLLLRAAFVQEPRRGWAIVLALATGARVASLTAIRPEHVHLFDPTGPWLWFATAKGDRPYALPLNRRGAIAAAHLLALGHDPILGVGSARFRQWVHAAEQSAGLERVWPHLFRHTFATKVAAAGDVEAWRRAMNHSDLSQWSRYVAGSDQQLRAATSGA